MSVRCCERSADITVRARQAVTSQSRAVMEGLVSSVLDIDIDPAHLFRYISQLDPRKPEKVKTKLKIIKY